MSSDLGRLATWIDLLDPTADDINAAVGHPVHPRALEWLAGPIDPDLPDARPKLEPYGDYIVGVLVAGVAVPDQDRVFYQEVGIVLRDDVVVTVRKTPRSEFNDPPFDPEALRTASAGNQQHPAGMFAYFLLDEIADRYLDLVQAVQEEITEAEDRIENDDPDDIRPRLSELRSDILHINRTLGPTRDAITRVIDQRVDTDGEELFPEAIEFEFRDVKDKLQRAVDGLEAAREMLAGVRDYHQAKVANDQNEVMKRLTVMASLVLLPTLIVGLYGQNFTDIKRIEPGGAWSSLVLIAIVTIAQLIFFKRNKWF